jgi:SNF2 family DNA or RNA helicase
MVHKMVCEGTLEERIDQLLDEKRELFKTVVGSGERWVTELDDDQLRELVMLAQEPKAEDVSA